MAATDIISRSPGRDVSLRSVCEAVGVKLPTLYHFFGSKKGLIDAVIDHGFDLYLTEKHSSESSGDPIQDIRTGWDVHVRFGLEHPGFYTLMYGQITPGYSPPAQSKPSQMLRSLTAKAAQQNRLVVPHRQAAAHILVCNIGVTLRQIILDEPDPDLSASVREGAIAAITGAGIRAPASLAAAIEMAATHPDVLGHVETQLLIEWLGRLRDHDNCTPESGSR